MKLSPVLPGVTGVSIQGYNIIIIIYVCYFFCLKLVLFVSFNTDISLQWDCLYPWIETGSRHTIQGISLDTLYQRSTVTLWSFRGKCYTTFDFQISLEILCVDAHHRAQCQSWVSMKHGGRVSGVIHMSLEAWRQIFRLKVMHLLCMQSRI